MLSYHRCSNDTGFESIEEFDSLLVNSCHVIVQNVSKKQTTCYMQSMMGKVPEYNHRWVPEVASCPQRPSEPQPLTAN